MDRKLSYLETQLNQEEQNKQESVLFLIKISIILRSK